MSKDSSETPGDRPPEEPVLDSRLLNSGASPAAGIPMAQFAASRVLETTGPAAEPLPTPVPPAGQVTGGYEIMEPIGAGGFSIVTLGRHVATGKLVALKFPRVAGFVAHLRKEALMAARFQDPQVVGILEVCLEQDPPFLVMPFVAGANLELPEVAPEPEGIVEAFRQFRGIVEVVARLHDAEIAHGDLKPGNIRVDAAGACHILDLGVARHQVAARQLSTLRASVVSVTGEKIAGTLAFMSPEIMSGSPPSKASDVYALGVILHHLLCGRPPAFGVSPGELNPFLPPGTADFLRHILQQDPELRLPRAGALLHAIDSFIRSEQRCLRRRNGHARRRVFMERMRTLARGARMLLWSAGLVFLGFASYQLYAASLASDPAHRPNDLTNVQGFLLFAGFLAGLVGSLLGITTINAWLLGVPEKTYKNRSGHPWWTFMMQ